VGSCSSQTARYYGSAAYYVFPFDGAKIGMCSDTDFWEAFSTVNERLNDRDISQLNDMISNTFERLGVYDNWSNILPDDMMKHLKHVDTILKDGPEKLEKMKNSKYTNAHYENILLQDMIDHYKGSMLDYCDALLDPDDNNFELKPIAQYDGEENNSREVWTDSDAVFINRMNMEKVEELLRT
jgi:hypothetical protein